MEGQLNFQIIFLEKSIFKIIWETNGFKQNQIKDH